MKQDIKNILKIAIENNQGVVFGDNDMNEEPFTVGFSFQYKDKKYTLALNELEELLNYLKE